MDQQHLVETALMACEFEHLLGEVGHLLEVGHRRQGDHHQEVQVGPGLEGDWDPWMLQVAERFSLPRGRGIECSWRRSLVLSSSVNGARGN